MNCTSPQQSDWFWIYSPSTLLTNFELTVPPHASWGRKMNAVTRLFTLCIALILAIAVLKPSPGNMYIPFLLGIVIIVVVYLINRPRVNTTTMENFSPCHTDVNVNNLLDYVHVPPPIHNDRFNTPPPYIPPSHNLDDWKQSTLAEHSAVNSNKGGYSLRTSGYKFSNAATACGVRSPYEGCEDKVLPYRACILPRTPVDTICSPSTMPTSVAASTIHDMRKLSNATALVEGFEHPPQDNNSGEGDSTLKLLDAAASKPRPSATMSARLPVYRAGDPFSRYTCEKSCTKGKTGLIDISSERCVAFPGDLIEHCGYNPDKGALAGMPHNQPISIDDYFPTLKQYHQDLNTQIIDPSGVYTTTEVNEPQMTNLGISFPQQFQPLKKVENCHGETLIVRKNPRLFTPIRKIYDYGEITPDSIFDPRSAGYGDARRTYIDQVTGQPRFYYDDINAARESNFITRNDIDVYNFTNQVGIFNERANDNPLEIVKQQTHEAFISNGNDHRHSLQESLMRKGNEKARQQRIAPLRRDVPTRVMK